jgi:hypothetical protein
MFYLQFFRAIKLPRKLVGSSLVFLTVLLVLGLAYQAPFIYTLNLGQSEDAGAVVKGLGDREHNQNFSFRWTVAPEAEIRLPDVGWPARLGLVGLAPRPDGKSPQATLRFNSANPVAFVVDQSHASQSPAEDGRLTFEFNGPAPHFQLKADSLTIQSETFQPANDPRSLGLVLNQLYLKPEPTRFGFTVPPLAQWLGLALAIVLVYLSLQKSLAENKTRYFLCWVITLSTLLVVVLVRLLFPQWLVVNGNALAWGLAFPLLVWNFIPQKYQTAGLLVQLGIGLGLLYYQQAPASLLLVQFGITGLLLADLVLTNHFSDHLQNVGLLTCLSALAGWLLWQNQLPRGVDLITYHLPWLNELDYLIRQGNLYPRWTPNFVWQQGWAIFNFYPPGSRYLAEIFHLFGLTFNNAVLLSLYLGTVAGTIGAYFYCREMLRDNRAALLGALAFCYLPYRFIDMLSSGAFANYLGGAVLPWLVWLITCLIRYPIKRGYVIGLGLCGALLGITSTPQLMVFLPVGIVYTLCLLMLERRVTRLIWRQRFFSLTLAFLLAFGLSAFYLMPATFEINQVGLKFARADLGDGSRFWAAVNGPFDFWQPIVVSLGSVNLFGTLPLWLALGGGLLLLRYRPDLRFYTGLLALVTGWAVFLQFPASRLFWETFSSLTEVQFTSRLWYSILVFAGPLIGGLALSLTTRAGRLLLPLTGLLAIGLLLYACFAPMDIAYWPESFDGTISRRSLIEQINNADSMYLPKGADLEAITRYAAPQFSDNRTGDTLKWELTGTDSYRLTANLSRDGDVIVPLFWFEGWWKVQDERGQELPSSPAPTTHHLSLNLATGEHTISIRWQDTPLRQLSNLLSLLTLVALLIYFIYFIVRRLYRTKPITSQTEVAEVEAVEAEASSVK